MLDRPPPTTPQEYTEAWTRGELATWDTKESQLDLLKRLGATEEQLTKVASLPDTCFSTTPGDWYRK